MKKKIIDFLSSDRDFARGTSLYMQHGQSLAFKTTLNRQGETPYNRNQLYEELRKLAGLTEEELAYYLAQPLIAVEPALGVAEPPAVDLPVSAVEKQQFLEEIPQEVIKTIRLRDEFPFLSLPDCPNELKILVSDRITAYHKYVEAHKRLFDATTSEELGELASTVVENYLENCQIWDELKCFKETGKVLGEHPIFKLEQRLAEIRSLDIPGLVRLKKSLENNLARTRKAVLDNPEHKETAARQGRIESYSLELAEVNRLLQIHA